MTIIEFETEKDRTSWNKPFHLIPAGTTLYGIDLVDGFFYYAYTNEKTAELVTENLRHGGPVGADNVVKSLFDTHVLVREDVKMTSKNERNRQNAKWDF